ncbi:hypothetical protein V2J09_021803 [Rumex salicifolius]
MKCYKDPEGWLALENQSMLYRPRYLKLSSPFVIRHHGFLLEQLHTKSNQDKIDQAGDSFGNKGTDDGGRFHLYKGLGQHLLTNTRILDTIVRRSNIRPTDTVLEIGPGTGNLTLKLLEASHKVVVIEIDKRMPEVLHKRVATTGFGDKLTVICQDALKAEFPHFDIVVANIPYGISSPLIAKLVFGARTFRSATLLLQKEFARRLMANPGDSEFNRLAVNVKLVADVEFIMDVSKREFLPNPKVDSSVIKIHPKVEVPEVDLNEWLAFTRTCFSKKNKTLGATFKQKKKLIELMRLSSFNRVNEITVTAEDEDDETVIEQCSPSLAASSCLDLSAFREKVIGVLRSNGFEDKRPSKLSIEELLQLLSLLNQQDIHFHGTTEDKQNVEISASYDP